MFEHIYIFKNYHTAPISKELYNNLCTLIGINKFKLMAYVPLSGRHVEYDFEKDYFIDTDLEKGLNNNLFYPFGINIYILFENENDLLLFKTMIL